MPRIAGIRPTGWLAAPVHSVPAVEPQEIDPTRRYEQYRLGGGQKLSHHERGPLESIDPNDAVILPHDANPRRMKFSERTTSESTNKVLRRRITPILA